MSRPTIMATRNGISQHITVYPIGTKCKIGDGIPAVVAGVRISGVGVDYYIQWWDGRARHGDNLDEFEIEFESKPTLNIGFHHAHE